ncbi:MAG: VIT1/CCC1 transporter family protein [Thermoplasmata archaeon]
MRWISGKKGDDPQHMTGSDESAAMPREKVIEVARSNLEEGEYWHKKVNVREIVFGFNDGSISTLALLSGVTGGALARGQALIAGLSGVIAGAISMAIGAYISSKSEIEHHRSEIDRERREIETVPEIEREELRQIYMKKAQFTNDELEVVVGRITSDKKTWLDSMMKEELGLFEERFERPTKLALVMFAAFVARGMMPVAPFLLIEATQTGLVLAALVTFVSLFSIGVWKTTFTDKNRLLSGTEMVLVGIMATVIPYLIGDLLLPKILSAFT